MFIGFRELVGLAALAVAAAIGLSFALADTQPEANGPGIPVRATQSPRSNVGQTDTVTVAPIEGESPWRVAFFRLDGDKAEVVSGSELTSLDLTFTKEPLPELEGARWRVTAQQTFTGPPGTYDIKLQYRGTAVIRANADDLARSVSPNRLRLLRATLEKGAADVTISIELEGAESGGIARWQLVKR